MKIDLRVYHFDDSAISKEEKELILNKLQSLCIELENIKLFITFTAT